MVGTGEKRKRKIIEVERKKEKKRKIWCEKDFVKEGEKLEQWKLSELKKRKKKEKNKQSEKKR